MNARPYEPVDTTTCPACEYEGEMMAHFGPVHRATCPNDSCPVVVFASAADAESFENYPGD